MICDASVIRSLHPIREGADIYVEIGSERVKLSDMQANLILQAWAEAVGGAMVAGPAKQG
jgi:hypothetical protein